MVQEHGSEEGVPEWTLFNLQHPSPLTVEQDGEDDGDDGEPCGWVAQEDVIEGCEEVLWVLAKPEKWDQREEKDHRGVVVFFTWRYSVVMSDCSVSSGTVNVSAGTA
jgi:hypothetical protein